MLIPKDNNIYTTFEKFTELITRASATTKVI